MADTTAPALWNGSGRRHRQTAIRPWSGHHGVRASGRHQADLLRLGALVALGDLEGHFLAFLQFPESLGVNVGVVRENVGTAAVLCDKSESLFRVEPLHRAGSH